MRKAQGGIAKVKPIVVKHVLTDNYLQKPEISYPRPDKEFSEASYNLPPKKNSPSTFARGGQRHLAPSDGPQRVARVGIPTVTSDNFITSNIPGEGNNQHLIGV